MTGKSDFTLHLYICSVYDLWKIPADTNVRQTFHMYSLQIRKVLRCLQLRLLKTFRKTFNDCTDGMTSWFLELANNLADSLKIFFNICPYWPIGIQYSFSKKCLHVILFLFSFWVQLTQQHVYFPSSLGILNTKFFTLKQKFIFVFLMETWKTTLKTLTKLQKFLVLSQSAPKQQDSFEFLYYLRYVTLATT